MKPSCEYCLATNRVCIYPSVENVGESKKKHKITHHKWKRLQKQRESKIVTVQQKQKMLTNANITKMSDILTPPVSLLFSNKSQLHVSSFELRLLHFFQHFCIPAFTNGAPEKVSTVWRNEVPFLWKQSKLLRMSVYLFSAMNLWPLCNLQELLDNDSEREKVLLLQSYVVDPDVRDNLYIATIEYFSSCLQLSTQEIGKLISSNETVSVIKSAEILLSGIMIFSFLGMHPHRIIPLVSFPDGGKSETDLLSICDGLRITFLENINVLLSSPYGGIFRSDECMEPEEELKYPIIENLKFRLQQELETEYSPVFKEAITQLEISLYRSIVLKYPRPLFRWILLQDVLNKCIKSKMPFALKILYNFASLCNICKYHVFASSNMWLDYIEWYKQENFRKYGDGIWRDMDDFSIYEFVMTSRKKAINVETLATLDPFVIATK